MRQPRGPLSDESTRSQTSSLVQAIERAARADRPHQLVGVRVAEGVGHRVLLLEQQAIAGTPGDAVQLDPRGEQDVVVGAERGVVALEHDRLGQLGPADGVHVAQAAPALLEVGFEQEGHLAGLGLAVRGPAC